MRPLPELPDTTHDFVDVGGGVRLHVASCGPEDGRDVVLLHGWPESWWLWRDALGPLGAAGLRAHAVDLRGFGWSDVGPMSFDWAKEGLAADVIAALAALDLSDVVLAGHDWGGYVAQLVALRAPERVARLVCLNMTPICGTPDGARRHAWRFLYQPVVAAPVLGPALHRSGLLERVLRDNVPGLSKADAGLLAGALREPDRAEAGSRVYRTFLRSEVGPMLAGRYRDARFAQPVLVLHGADDPVVRPSLLPGYVQMRPDVRIELVERTGHFIVDERPALVAERLVAEARTPS